MSATVDQSMDQPAISRLRAEGVGAAAMCWIRLPAFFTLLALVAFASHQIIGFSIRNVEIGEVGAFNRAMSGDVDAEILISGSSRALVQYDPAILGDALKMRAFNLGRNASHTDFQAAVLEAYLARNEPPALVVQNLDSHSFEPTVEIYEPGQYVPHLGIEPLYRGLQKIDSDVWRWKYLPLYGYAVEDLKLIWLRSFFAHFLDSSQPNLGYSPNDLQWTGEFDAFKLANPAGVPRRIEPDGVSALVKIIQLCHAANARLVFVYSPEYAEAQSFTSNRAALFHKFHSIAAANGIRFLDFSSSDICRDRANFYNSQHLNRNGAEKFSRELGAKLLQIAPDLGLPNRESARWQFGL
jgi:hypothetical protein